MASWSAFANATPELAALARERFEARQLLMLGTLRRNGWPRISPIEFTFFEDDLVVGGMWRSKKMLDLLRDSRCTLHSATSNKDGQEGDVKIYARAFPLAPEREERYWQHVFDVIGWRPDGPAHAFTIDIESAGYIRFDGEGTMRWLTWPGPNQWQQRKSV